MSQIRDLYNEFLSLDFHNDNVVIEFFKTKKLIIENSTIKNEEDSADLLNLINFHLKSLFTKGYTSKCVKASFTYEKRLIDLYSSTNKEIKSDLNELLFFRGASFYGLKKYKESNTIFKKLVEYDKENDTYKSWLSANKKEITNQNDWIYLLIGSVLIFGSDYLPFSADTKLIVTSAGAGILAVFAIRHIRLYINKLYEKNNQHN